MKKFTKLVTLMTAAAMLFSLPTFSSLKASAAEPATYSIGYMAEKGEWRWQDIVPFNEDKDSSDLFYLNDHIKDGDSLVIYGPASESITIDVNAYLSSLTLAGTEATAVVHTKGIDEVFVLANSVAAINGNVKNAYVYDNGRVTFNNNVNNLEINAPDDVYSVATCGGTVGHVKGFYEDHVFFDIYNVAAGKLVIEANDIEMDAQFYSTTPSAPATQPAPSTQTGSTGSVGEYDSVPKTGEPNTVIVLLGIAAACLVGRRVLTRTK